MKSFWLICSAALVAGGCGNSDASQSGTGAGSNKLPSSGAPVVAPVPTLTPTTIAASGKDVWLKYCALCHGVDAKGYAADNAPSMVTASFLASADAGFLKNSIVFGRPGTAMAPYGKAQGGPLSDEEITALTKYIRELGGNPPLVALPSPGVGNAARGAKVYQANCQKCHGDTKQRSTAVHLGNPLFLAHATDAYLLYAIRNGRAGTLMEPWSDKLTAAQQADVIAFIRGWQTKPGDPPAVFQSPTGSEPLVINPKGKNPKFTLREERFVSVDAVAAALKAKQKMIILDARLSSEWSQGHIPGALAVPYYAAKEFDRLPNDGTWVLAYCACPHHASGMVIDELRKRGFKNTAVIDEGILVWKQRGYPIKTAELKPEAAAAGANGMQAPHAAPPPHEDHTGHNH